MKEPKKYKLNLYSKSIKEPKKIKMETIFPNQFEEKEEFAKYDVYECDNNNVFIPKDIECKNKK